MKRKVIAALLAALMVTGITGCAITKPDASDVTSDRIVVENESTNKPEEDVKENEDEKPDEDETDKEDADKENEEKDSASNKGVVFGSDEAKGYTGFEYLMEELISTSETKSGEKASFSAFVPEDDYPSVSGSSARSERMGVEFEIDLEPYLQYNAKDYTVKENLEKHVEDELSYSTYKYGIEIGEVEEVDDKTAVCVVTYMDYDSYDDKYEPVYEVYKLQEMNDGITVLFMVSINAEETTGKTKALLGELSSFYQMDIAWDESFAETKKTAFENSDEFNQDAFNLVYMSFELPEGWEKDEKNSSYNEPVFAPGGNARTASGYITVSKDFSSDNYVEALLEDTEYTEQALTDSMGDTVSDIKVEAVKDSFMGEVAKVEMKVSDDDIQGKGTGIIYYGYKDYEVYMIIAFISDGASEEEAEDVRDAIDMIFETGKLKE